MFQLRNYTILTNVLDAISSNRSKQKLRQGHVYNCVAASLLLTTVHICLET